MSFKIGVVGCGGFAEYAHGPAQVRVAAKYPELELAACCDMDETKAKTYAHKFGFRKYYTNLEAMLDRGSLDAVFSLVSPRYTVSVSELILQRGLPLLLEKPPGLTSLELERLIRVAERHAAPTQVAFNRRYMPIMVEALRILDAEIPSRMQVNYVMTRFGRSDLDFSTTAIHAIDASQFLCGSPYQKATLDFGIMEEIPESRSNVHIQAVCESGTRVSILIQPMSGLTSEAFSVHGVGASLEGHLFGPGGNQSHGYLTHWKNDAVKSTFTDEKCAHGERLGIDGEIAAFCRAIQEGALPTPSLLESRQQVRLMEAIRARATQTIDFRKEVEHLCSIDQIGSGLIENDHSTSVGVTR